MENLQLEYSSTIDNIVAANDSFDKGRMLVAYTGLNRNNSFISKEAFEKAIPTMYNCPVVANYTRDESGDTWGEIGEHDGEVIDTPNGAKYIAITEPVGVIPESASYNWVNVKDGNEMHEYLSVDILLWKRQEAYQKIKNDGIVKQSMEISVSDGEFTDGYYKINDFEFTAFCLLGSAEPCFESAALFTNEGLNKFKAEFSKMMSELKEYYINDIPDDNEEVEENMGKFEELLEKFNVTIEDIKFEYEGLSDEELEAKFAEAFTNNDEEPKEEPEAEPEAEPKKEPEEEPKNGTEDNYALVSDIRNQLAQQIAKRETYTEIFGDYEYEYSKYYFHDFDVDANEVYYATFEEDTYKIYGASYKLDGDDVVIDFENEKRKKLVYVDYVHGEKEFTYDNPIHEMKEHFKKAFDAQTEKLEDLVEYKKNIEKAANDKAKDELFAKFENQLKENEQFEKIKENKDEYTVEALEKELFALYGAIQLEASFKKDVEKKKPVKVSNDFTKENNTINNPYGDLFSKYGYVAKEDK